MTTERKIIGTFRGAPFHWVGDGFRVTNYFSGGNKVGYDLSPYVLMDYHPSFHYPPTDNDRRGVGPHPHRGFETVTVAFEGSIAHHDSAGNGGVIGPGDVQWMTAGSGILHREYHEKEYAKAGGPMHMMQIWVNLPKAHKMDPPRYQSLTAERMGRIELPAGGLLRIIAGAYQGVKGPAITQTPMNLFDIRLAPQGSAAFSFPARENTALLVMQGEVRVNRKTDAGPLDFVLFGHEGEEVVVESRAGAHLLLLNGEPIEEPVVQYGPFVMNTREEIVQAVEDFNSGRFGTLEG